MSPQGVGGGSGRRIRKISKGFHKAVVRSRVAKKERDNYTSGIPWEQLSGLAAPPLSHPVETPGVCTCETIADDVRFISFLPPEKSDRLVTFLAEEGK